MEQEENYLEKLTISELKHAILVISETSKTTLSKTQAVDELKAILNNSEIITNFYRKSGEPEKFLLKQVAVSKEFSLLDALRTCVNFGVFSIFPISRLVNLGILQKEKEGQGFNFSLKLSFLLSKDFLETLKNSKIEPPKQGLHKSERAKGTEFFETSLIHFFLEKHGLTASKSTDHFLNKIFNNFLVGTFREDFEKLSGKNIKEIFNECLEVWATVFLGLYLTDFSKKEAPKWKNLILDACKMLFSQNEKIDLQKISELTENFPSEFPKTFKSEKSNSFKRISFLAKIISEDFVKLGLVTEDLKPTRELYGEFLEVKTEIEFLSETFLKIPKETCFLKKLQLSVLCEMLTENTFKLSQKRIFALLDKGFSVDFVEKQLKKIIPFLPENLNENIKLLKERQNSVVIFREVSVYEIEDRKLWLELKKQGFNCISKKFVFLPEKESKNFEMKFLRKETIVETSKSKPLIISEGNLVIFENEEMDFHLEVVLEKMCEKVEEGKIFRLTKESFQKGIDLGIKVEDLDYVISKVAFGEFETKLLQTLRKM
ncbi:hypothetical protein IT568_11530 [bacterium]|nr:hypothetical protein [bacterium]